MITVKKTTLKGVLLITLDVFKDHRGCYIETYNEQDYYNKDIRIKFVQDDISVSKKNVLRGIHGDERTWKLISCLDGEFYLVIINCDIQSVNFGKWQSFTLSAKNRLQVLVPPKYGNGHLVLSKTTIFHYKQSTYYQGVHKQFTYKWNDPQLNISWPIKNPILSQRDNN